MLTVRKNYRPLAYHGWPHGFSVAHILWLIFTESPDTFIANEVRGQQSILYKYKHYYSHYCLHYHPTIISITTIIITTITLFIITIITTLSPASSSPPSRYHTAIVTISLPSPLRPTLPPSPLQP